MWVPLPAPTAPVFAVEAAGCEAPDAEFMIALLYCEDGYESCGTIWLIPTAAWFDIEDENICLCTPWGWQIA